MKPHKFSELVNDIRYQTVRYVNPITSDTRLLWDCLKANFLLKNLTESQLHHIFCTCKAYCNAGQLRAQIVTALKDCGIEPDHARGSDG